MRLILDHNEIVSIVARHFDLELDPGKVVIRTDPLEIEVSGLPLVGGNSSQPAPTTAPTTAPQTAPQAALRPADAELDGDLETPTPGVEGVEGVSVSDGSIHAMLATSQQLAAELDRKNPQLRRNQGTGLHASSKPPADQSSEI